MEETRAIRGTIGEDFLRSVIRMRPRDMHKGSCGRVLLCAGSAGMTGAAVLAARAALRSGAGLVYAAAPEEAFPVLQILAPEAICVKWEDAAAVLEGRQQNGRDISYDAVGFGPGVGLGPEAGAHLRLVLQAFRGPVVLDADGLNALAGDPELRALALAYPGEIILTPHPGEAARLLRGAGMEALPAGEDRRAETVRALAEAYGAIAVLKGAGTLVCRAGHVAEAESSGGAAHPEAAAYEIRENPTGNPGMATAGSGDVLTGLITALCAQGLDPWDAAQAGVFLHGRAGDLAAEDKGEYGLIASDICEALPAAIKPYGGTPSVNKARR